MSEFQTALVEQPRRFENPRVQFLYEVIRLKDSDTEYVQAKTSMDALSESLSQVLTASSNLGSNTKKRVPLVQMYNEVSGLQTNVLTNLPLIVAPAKKLLRLAFKVAKGGMDPAEKNRRVVKLQAEFNRIDDQTLHAYQKSLGDTINSAIAVMITEAGEGGAKLEGLKKNVEDAKSAVDAGYAAWNAELAVNCKASAAKHYHELQETFGTLQVYVHLFSSIIIQHIINNIYALFN